MKFCLQTMAFENTDKEHQKLALSGSDRDLTWNDFKAEVDKCVESLKSFELPPGHPVIIYGHKEVTFVCHIVACMILKLPYVPIDNIFPRERMEAIQNLLKSALVVNAESKDPEQLYSFESAHQQTSYWRPEDPIVYIMFTSGSSGTPKGVQITQKAILSYTDWIREVFPFKEEDVFFNQIPFSFDLSTYELFCFLLYGAQMICFSRDLIQDPEAFVRRLKTYECTIWNSTPSFLSLSMMNQDFEQGKLPSLTHFFLAGEAMTHKVVRRLFSKFPQKHLYNTYGPTEVTNTSTFVEITLDMLDSYPVLPVGFPKKTTGINLIDPKEEKGEMVGEIELVGENVSIGYFENDLLNKEKFYGKEGERAFRTGDFGFFKDGMLFFLGRRDDLVKLHGYRIEIAEIDKVIEELFDPVTTAVTIPLKRAEVVAKLVTYVKMDKGKSVTINEIKNKLKEKLPYYMIPAEILCIEDFFYNNNGKVDRKKLREFYLS